MTGRSRRRHRDAAGVGDQAEPDLPAAGQLDIDLREQLRVEQGAVLDAVAAVDPEAHAQGVEAVLGARMPGARKGQRVDHPAACRPAARPQRSSSKLRKPKSKPALCATSGESSMNSSSSSACSAKRGLSDRKMVGQAVDRLGLERHVALGIEISVEVAAGLDAVEDLDAADLDHAVAAGRVEPGGFRIEDDFPHAANYPRRGESETSENVAHLALQLWIGRRRCR